ncbi:MAG: arginase family protein [Bacteroidia bacterium]|nr:arginase family protein [Bacteroidia bacterium]
MVAIACDWGGSQPGGVAGVQAWYALGLHYKHLAWIEAQHLWLSPGYEKPVWTEAGPHVYARRLEPWWSFAQVIEEKLQGISLEVRTLFLTGDHSWSGRILPFLARRIGRVGVIWMDAHADLHNPATSPSGHLHGMPLAMATGINEERFHPVPSFTWSLWEQIVQPLIQPSDILYIGLRSYEPPEMELIQRHGIPYFTAEMIIKEGMEAPLQAAEAIVQRCDVLYLSLDVDVWDPAFARGTGAPAPGGLSIGQVRTFLKEAFLWEKVRFVEVTEINPLLDRDNQTALFAYGTVRPFIEGSVDATKFSLE